mgnify:CR=1 FL=1
MGLRNQAAPGSCNILQGRPEQGVMKWFFDCWLGWGKVHGEDQPLHFGHCCSWAAMREGEGAILNISKQEEKKIQETMGLFADPR